MYALWLVLFGGRAPPCTPAGWALALAVVGVRVVEIAVVGVVMTGVVRVVVCVVGIAVYYSRCVRVEAADTCRVVRCVEEVLVLAYGILSFVVAEIVVSIGNGDGTLADAVA